MHPAQEEHQQAKAQVAADHEEGPVPLFLQAVFGQQLQARARGRGRVHHAQPDRTGGLGIEGEHRGLVRVVPLRHRQMVAGALFAPGAVGAPAVQGGLVGEGSRAQHQVPALSSVQPGRLQAHPEGGAVELEDAECLHGLKAVGRQRHHIGDALRARLVDPEMRLQGDVAFALGGPGRAGPQGEPQTQQHNHHPHHPAHDSRAAMGRAEGGGGSIHDRHRKHL
ncbi:MAG: hypothetical protein A3G82_04220 [Burkholderiales bacterium RIFCSPLOWO2_12_FULL_67_210]|nr:MAG: hypothetical protein A3G82_04220 [Burkholderiales bacterium RIFCSPLOWO2_12_FULL_67_210]